MDISPHDNATQETLRAFRALGTGDVAPKELVLRVLTLLNGRTADAVHVEALSGDTTIEYRLFLLAGKEVIYAQGEGRRSWSWSHEDDEASEIVVEIFSLRGTSIEAVDAGMYGDGFGSETYWTTRLELHRGGDEPTIPFPAFDISTNSQIRDRIDEVTATLMSAWSSANA